MLAVGPRMLRLTGRLAEGLLISIAYVPPEKLSEFNRLIDEGAAQAGRPPTSIRQGYNIFRQAMARLGVEARGQE